MQGLCVAGCVFNFCGIKVCGFLLLSSVSIDGVGAFDLISRRAML